jgi:prolipoprotein diacylglyceryltransferase
MIAAGVNPLTSPGDILIVRGGVSTAFASIGASAVLVWTHRSTLPRALDHLAPAATAGLAGWHGGCLWRGTCLGTSSDLPWAMTSAGTSVSRHPVELYAALAFLMAVPLLVRFIDRPWVASGAALALAGSVRLATEPLRLSIVGGPVGWYGAAVAAGTLGAVLGHSRMRTRPPGPPSIEM